MLTIIYDPEKGDKFRDSEVENAVLDAYQKYSSISVANELFILAARVLVREGKIPHTDIQFDWEGKIHKINKRGLSEDCGPEQDAIVTNLLTRLNARI